MNAVPLTLWLATANELGGGPGQAEDEPKAAQQTATVGEKYKVGQATRRQRIEGEDYLISIICNKPIC